MCGGGDSSSSKSNMESFQADAATDSGGGTGEVRRLNVVYFLSRDGRLEHPHLIRVHHFYRHGVHLHDVKRWLADLRGKDMAESYSWSYKRRYKSGYVWQDLMDDDLITPIADNEYVLKGSLLPSFSTPNHSSPSEKTKEAGEESQMVRSVPPETLQIEHEDEMVSPKPPPQLDQDSPGQTSLLEDASEKANRLFKPEFVDIVEERKEGQKPFLHEGDHTKKKTTIWSFLSCREVETNVSTVKPAHRRLAGTEAWDHTDANRRSRKEGEKALSSMSYKPTSEPNCS
ncbi:hypothetical protein J5N97_027414 [Dioscorea zingiberensis]|uniref:SOSEKI DIX-like domain-containing protein n=1 Tax=Dioscorea zingiberensis TaxID=325984 RepID=A0A9D5C4C8_9LILI|nr:hypothetical protein J5N97_027414 [Dioscorea zingiberensis]